MDLREGHLGLTCSTASVCSGALVDSVHPKDLCARHGLAAGHVIRSINGSTVATHDDAMEMLNAAKEKSEKVAIVHLSPEEAKKEGEVEWAQTKKIVLMVTLCMVAIISLGIAAVTNGWIKLPELPEPDASPPPPSTPNMDDVFNGPNGDMMQKIKEQMGADGLAKLQNMMAGKGPDGESMEKFRAKATAAMNGANSITNP